MRLSVIWNTYENSNGPRFRSFVLIVSGLFLAAYAPADPTDVPNAEMPTLLPEQRARVTIFRESHFVGIMASAKIKVSKKNHLAICTAERR